MRRYAIVAFAIVASLLVISATPATAASTNHAVGSQHTTATEFQNATISDNMTVEGSGDAGSIALSGGMIDDFEDSDGSEWGNTNDGNSYMNAQTTVVWEGQYSGYFAPPNDAYQSTFRPLGETYKDTVNVSFATRIENIGGDSEGIVLSGSGGDAVGITTNSGEWGYVENNVFNSVGVTANSDTWYTIKLAIDVDTGTFDYYINGSQAGSNLGFGDSGVSSIENIEVYRHDSSSGNGIYIDAIESTHPNTGQYISANHSVSNAASASINVTQLSNATATLTAEYYDGNAWQSGGQMAVTSPANHTISLADVDSSTWRLNATVEKTGRDPAFTIADEGILFQNDAPSIDNNTASPTQDLEQSSQTFEIDVSDNQFGTTQGEELNASLYIDGSFIGSDTLTSNGTASVSTELALGGDYSYYWIVTDQYGGDTQSQTFDIRVPSTLTIYNESTDPSVLNNTSTTLRFYYDNGTSLGYSERQPIDGAVNLTGLPAAKPMVVSAEGDGYYQRRIFVRSLYDQQQIYLLNESEQSVETIFEISDYSGAYSPDTTVLEVQRAINGSWQTVEGDYFGATGEFGTILEYNARYRLVLYNTETQKSRTLGIYQPTTAQQTRITVSPSGEIEEVARDPSAVISPQTRRLPAVNGTAVSADFRNNTNDVSSWRIEAIVEETNTTLWDDTVSDTSSYQHDLDVAARAGQHIQVTVYATFDGQEQSIESARFTIADTPTNDNSLLSTLADLEGLAAPGTTESFTWFIAMLVTVLGVAAVGATLPVGGETAGLAGVLILVGFSAIGWVSYDVVFAAGVAVVSLALLRRGI